MAPPPAAGRRLLSWAFTPCFKLNPVGVPFSRLFVGTTDSGHAARNAPPTDLLWP